MDLFSKLRKMNILLVDDDELIRHSMTLFFEFEGCRLHTVATAEEGLKELEKKTYDIIIADYRLPGIDGLELLERSREINPYAMKILLTAYGSKEIVSEAHRLGAQDFIPKPFTMEAIEDSLARLIELDEARPDYHRKGGNSEN